MDNLKEKIKTSIKNFKTKDLYTGSIDLLSTLGYKSDKKHRLSTGSFNEFKDIFIENNVNFQKEKALTENWEKAEFLFQITEDEIKISSQFSLNFEINEINRNEYVSYIFMAIKLKDENYARGKLSKITRELNKLFPMPVMILFKIGNKLTFSIINRRPNKIKRDKDVLEKVTLIKDIDILNPHRAHIDILYDLSLKELSKEYEFTNFFQLHNAWQKVLDISELNNKFYQELSNWYFWALTKVHFPKLEKETQENSNSIALIRLLTRLIFVWFIKEKGLVPNMLFKKPEIDKYIKKTDKTQSTYYKAILQNLFFATLNLEMNKDKPCARKFIERHGYYSQQNLMPAYRYSRFFKKPNEALKIFENIPFLNGGLFENLDYERRENGKRTEKRIDCFSDKIENEEILKVPDFLFFSEEKQVGFSKEYDDKRKKNGKVKGIINILKNYKFTVEENTPIEEEIALDPELLGQVFENLLASYNPETQTTARKSTGSYYTPREIVNYMVDESLIAYFDNKFKEELPDRFADMDNLDELLREFFAYTEKEHPFDSKEINVFIKAIDNIKILDPACGSGSFPMGILQKLVYLLSKLDKKNELWQKRQIEKVKGAISAAEKIEDSKLREETISDLGKRIKDIKQAFEKNELDYGRKLFLIENCIYGVDIQSIAIQISKLRFFISLVIEQDININKKNFGIRALPNLETKFVVANTLIGLDKPNQETLRNPKINEKEKELLEIRRKHFNAITRKDKKKYRIKDENLRNEISELLINDGWSNKTAHKIAGWDPYNQNLPSDFFDKEWMFGIKDGFDIVIANPPYNARLSEEEKVFFKSKYESVSSGRQDTSAVFVELALNIGKKGMQLTYILPYRLFSRKRNHGQFQKFILNNFSIKNIIYLGSEVGFSSNDEFMILLMNSDYKPDTEIKVSFKPDLEKLNCEQNILKISQTKFIKKEEVNLNLLKFDEYLLQKIENKIKPLGDIGYVKDGIVPFIREKMVKKQKEDERYVKFAGIAGKYKLKKYYFSAKELYLCYDINEAKKYISEKKELRKVQLRKKEIFLNEKIITAQNSSTLKGTIDSNQFFVSNSIHSTYLKEEYKNLYDLKYILALINSTLINYYHNSLRLKGTDLHPQILIKNLKKLPIKEIPEKMQKPFIYKVEKIISLKKAGKDTTDLENQIDVMVYKLYELTYEEVKIVDPEILLTKEEF
ncbi:MAG: N-6 DNA methylase [Candidatus Cloacimonetes bacterium]|nr:N-6 DNA methylase [Candidatus Cloacimonadota bacterium]